MMFKPPSSLRLSGTPEQQTAYIVNYLNQLVKELNQTVNRNSQFDYVIDRTVRDIGYVNGKLAITYTDGAVKYINIGE